MNRYPRRNHAIYAKIAVGALVVLALLLGARIAGKAAAAPREHAPPVPPVPEAVPVPPAPPAVVLPPETVDLSELPTPPCWSCREGRSKSLEIQVDLDLLAPLGDGGENAALWFHPFSRVNGARLPEFDLSRERMEPVRVRGRDWKVLPADDPLLLEAEPWADQAECRFYPELIDFDGMETALPNLLLTINLARSWVARGDAAEDPVLAMEDYRRAVRIGRLFLQDDVTLIQNLVGMACVRYGVEGIFERAREAGDAATMAAAGLALGDLNAIRLLIAERVTMSNEVLRHVDYGWFGPSLDATDEVVEQVLGRARDDSERTMRIEAILSVWVVRHAGTRDQRAKATALLEALTEDEDPWIEKAARWALEQPADRESFAMIADTGS